MDGVRIRSALAGSLDPAPDPDPAPGDRLAAVLAPLALEPEPTLVFTERATTLSRHAGEVSFPGGLQDPGDASLVATALREANEELGIDPASAEVVGALEPVHTFVSGILVVPFVGVLTEIPVFSVSDAEIGRVLTTSVARLFEVESTTTWQRPGGRSWTGWVYDLDGATVWGATGRMLHDLLRRWREAGL